MNKEKAKERAAMLATLRQEHQGSLHRAQALLKEQQAIRKQLRQALADAPHTIPELAQATGLQADVVLWHISSMKKYDLATEVGPDDSGEYYLYGLSKELRR